MMNFQERFFPQSGNSAVQVRCPEVPAHYDEAGVMCACLVISKSRSRIAENYPL